MASTRTKRRAVAPGDESPLVAQPRRREPLDMEQLHRFVTVARAGGFTAAARMLRVAQPAVSRSVQSLEAALGQRLIERTSRRFALTPLGERLLAESDPLLDRLDALRSLVDSEDLNLRGALRFGATEPVAAAILPPALASLTSRYPRLHPYLVVAPTRDLTARLGAADLELVLTFHPLRGAELVRRALASFRFHVVVAADRVRDPRTCESFLGSREVEDERERTFPALQAWRAHWPRARIRMSTNSAAAQLELVRMGTGVAVLPEFLVQRDLAEGRLVACMGEFDGVFPLLVVRRKGPASDAAKVLLDALSATLPRIAGAVIRSRVERRS